MTATLMFKNSHCHEQCNIPGHLPELSKSSYSWSLLVLSQIWFGLEIIWVNDHFWFFFEMTRLGLIRLYSGQNWLDFWHSLNTKSQVQKCIGI